MLHLPQHGPGATEEYLRWALEIAYISISGASTVEFYEKVLEIAVVTLLVRLFQV